MIPFTFGIITDGTVDERIHLMIDSIEQQDIIKDYEILIIGNSKVSRLRTKVIPFDESQKMNGRAWITRKKNIIAQQAQNDCIVFMHDYFILDPEWYIGFLNYGTDWDVCVNRINTLEGPRHSDWLVSPYDLWDTVPEAKNTWNLSLTYDTKGLTRIQYISGGFFLAKRQFMIDNPLDESLGWGESEDVRWSEKVRLKTTFQVNASSSCHLLKPGKWQPGLIPPVWLYRMMDKFGLELQLG